jgi:hypothetical protein
MIEPIPGLPDNVVGFRASGEITKKDYDHVVFPMVSQHLRAGKELNYVFMVDTSLKDFTFGAWVQDIWLGLKDLLKWHRVAIVSDSEKIRSFTNRGGHLIPGHYKGFTKGQLDEAIHWAAVGESNTVSR